jgi:anti-anti-sigma factor
MTDSNAILSVDTELGDGVVTITPVGEFDIAGVEAVEGELQRAESGGPDLVVIDLTRTSFLDSSALRVILAAHARARDNGRRLVLRPGPPEVQRVFELAGLADGRLAFSDEARPGDPEPR